MAASSRISDSTQVLIAVRMFGAVGDADHPADHQQRGRREQGQERQGGDRLASRSERPSQTTPPITTTIAPNTRLEIMRLPPQTSPVASSVTAAM